MVVRPYADADLEEVLDVWYRASRIAHSFLEADFFERERAEIAHRWMPMAETFVFDVDDGVVGFLSLVGDEVGAVFVDPDLQGRGIGRALMNEARARRDHLELSVFEANPIGRRFYAAYGFEEIGRQTNEATGHLELRLRLESPEDDERDHGSG